LKHLLQVLMVERLNYKTLVHDMNSTFENIREKMNGNFGDEIYEYNEPMKFVTNIAPIGCCYCRLKLLSIVDHCNIIKGRI